MIISNSNAKKQLYDGRGQNSYFLEVLTMRRLKGDFWSYGYVMYFDLAGGYS